MVWDALKKKAQDGLTSATNFGSAAKNAAAGAFASTVETAAQFADKSAALAKQVQGGTLSVVVDVKNSVVNTGTYVIETADGAYTSVQSGVRNQITDLDDGINGLRNTIANDMQDTTDSLASGAGAVAELVVAGSLIVGTGGVGIFFYPLVAGKADKLVDKAVGGLTDPFIGAIRSKRLEFLETYDVPCGFVDAIFNDTDGIADVLAMVYMPGEEGTDRRGVALVNEETLFNLTRCKEQAEHDAGVFQEALSAVVERKKALGIEPLYNALRLQRIEDNMAARLDEMS